MFGLSSAAEYTSVLPSRDRVGWRSGPAPSVNRFAAPPVAGTDQSADVFSRKDENSTNLPSDDHTGSSSRASSFVSLEGVPRPVAGTPTMNRSRWPR